MTSKIASQNLHTVVKSAPTSIPKLKEDIEKALLYKDYLKSANIKGSIVVEPAVVDIRLSNYYLDLTIYEFALWIDKYLRNSAFKDSIFTHNCTGSGLNQAMNFLTETLGSNITKVAGYRSQLTTGRTAEEYWSQAPTNTYTTSKLVLYAELLKTYVEATGLQPLVDAKLLPELDR